MIAEGWNMDVYAFSSWQWHGSTVLFYTSKLHHLYYINKLIQLILLRITGWQLTGYVLNNPGYIFNSTGYKVHVGGENSLTEIHSGFTTHANS